VAKLFLEVDRQNIDARSSEIQCALRIRNESDGNVRLIWVRTSSTTGSSVQRVLDSTLENDRKQLDELYHELEALLRPVVYRKVIRPSYRGGNPFAGITDRYYIWRGYDGQPRVRYSSDAEGYRQNFVAGDTDFSDLNTVLEIKIANASRLEQRLAVGPASVTPLSDTIYLADIEPDSEFSRNYVIRCKRRLFATAAYAINFDIQYKVAAGTPAQSTDYVTIEPLYTSKGFTPNITPNPFFINLAAILFSVFGVLLKISLDMLKNVDDLSWGVIEDMLGSGPMILSFVSAALTALFFYNIYEWTEIGRRIEGAVGWRSALIIGGMSGLLNQKVVAALEALFG
jgi:hypothetical protein